MKSQKPKKLKYLLEIQFINWRKIQCTHFHIHFLNQSLQSPAAFAIGDGLQISLSLCNYRCLGSFNLRHGKDHSDIWNFTRIHVNN